MRSHRLRAVEAAPSADAAGRPGEPLQVEQVFRAHVSYVAAIALRLLNNEDETDDLIQDVFVVAAEGLHRLREPGAVKGWLASITVRLALRRLRRRRFLRFFTSGAPEDLQAVATRCGDPEDRLLLAEVYATLDEIPAAQRVAWVLRHLEGETVDRVAMLCGCSLATAKRRIADAHDRIRKLAADG